MRTNLTIFSIVFLVAVIQGICGIPINEDSHSDETFLDSDSVIKAAVLIHQVKDDDNMLMPRCSGVIISKRHVLTLKSCIYKVTKANRDDTVNDEDLEELKLSVEVGFSGMHNKVYAVTDVLKSSGDTLKVSGMSSSMLSTTSGVAILVAEKPFSGYPYAVNSTVIPVRTNVAEGDEVVAIGFGGNKRLWDEISDEPGVATLVNVVGGDNCENDFNSEYVNEKTMCLEKPYVEIGCSYDLGGPILTSTSIKKTRLVGLQYGSKQCFNGKSTSVALYLGPYRSFINDVIKDDV